MNEVKAYIRETMLDVVIDALAVIPGLPGIAVVHLRAFGHAIEAGEMTDTEMVKLEIDVPEELVEPVVAVLVAHARTGDGHPGDGKVFVSRLHDAIRIADGVRGAAAVRR